jgi:rare lipoprotein A
MRALAVGFLAAALSITTVVEARPPNVKPKTEEGLASFYGGQFHGKETASGETFDKNDLTAAHPKYPGGTKLKVTNLENDRSVMVRVIDRGPAKPERREGVIIDLSRAAAKRLDFTDDGRARVRIEVVKMGKFREN